MWCEVILLEWPTAREGAVWLLNRSNRSSCSEDTQEMSLSRG